MGGIVMKYKVGDKVRVKSKEWYDENKNERGIIKFSTNSFINEMVEYLGMEVIIDKVFNTSYSIKEDKGVWSWTDEMFEDEITMEYKHKFKCKDEVIIRRKNKTGRWCYAIFSHEDDEFICLCGCMALAKSHHNILPYKGNEHLVGTTGEQLLGINLEKGETVLSRTSHGNWVVAEFVKFDEEGILVKLSNEETTRTKWIVPFSDFNPRDMKSTKEKILMVAAGKLVKANLK